jgi:YidC/Oxa1 family membrane protein insertase
MFMDRKTVIAFILIGLVIIFYPLYVELITGGRGTLQRAPTGQHIDTLTSVKKGEGAIPIPEGVESTLVSKEKKEALAETVPLISADTLAKEKLVEVETNLYKAFFSSKGGNLIRFVLKKFNYSRDGNIQLIPQDDVGALDLEFPQKGIDFKDYNFSFDKKNIFCNEKIKIDTLEFILKGENGLSVIKRYIFYHDKYNFDLELEINGLSNSNLGRQYQLSFNPGLSVTEKNQKEDLSFFAGYSLLGDELVKLDHFKQEKGDSVGILDEARSGKTRWVATRSKYFLASIVPLSKDGSGFLAKGTRIFSTVNNVTSENKRIGVAIEMEIDKDEILKEKFMVYLGPVDYKILKSYNLGLENTVNLGWKIIRPFSILILWIFTSLYKIVANYGLVIIIFTILMKALFHPLTHKSVMATAKMQEIQPLIEQLKEKYKKDPQRLNQEMMKIYKEHGVNPFGGCLPLLFQMPLFYALFVVCRSTIELRGAKFVFWLEDLSQMDPYYVLPIIMSIAMFWQQKITIKDPKQMALVYIMPLIFFFMFKSFPAGLTLYWTFFNILSLAEQYYIKWKTKPSPVPISK